MASGTTAKPKSITSINDTIIINGSSIEKSMYCIGTFSITDTECKNLQFIRSRGGYYSVIQGDVAIITEGGKITLSRTVKKYNTNYLYYKVTIPDNDVEEFLNAIPRSQADILIEGSIDVVIEPENNYYKITCRNGVVFGIPMPNIGLFNIDEIYQMYRCAIGGKGTQYGRFTYTYSGITVPSGSNYVSIMYIPEFIKAAKCFLKNIDRLGMEVTVTESTAGYEVTIGNYPVFQFTKVGLCTAYFAAENRVSVGDLVYDKETGLCTASGRIPPADINEFVTVVKPFVEKIKNP